MHLGRVAAVPLVALDRPGKPPSPVRGRRQESLAQLARGASEGDPLEAAAVIAGIAQTTSSIAPEYSQSGRYVAFVFPRRNHQATATVAIIVGMMIASMMAVELMRIVFSALPTGPTGSRMPRLQPVVSRVRAAVAAMRRLLFR